MNLITIKCLPLFFVSDHKILEAKLSDGEETITKSPHQRLTSPEDKEMDNLRRWFSDKLALGLGNGGLTEKPQVLTQMNIDGTNTSILGCVFGLTF